jgi:hypothetical protein
VESLREAQFFLVQNLLSGFTFESPDQRQVFLVLLVLPWWILDHAQKVLDEIYVKKEEALLIYF